MAVNLHTLFAIFSANELSKKLFNFSHENENCCEFIFHANLAVIKRLKYLKAVTVHGIVYFSQGKTETKFILDDNLTSCDNQSVFEDQLQSVTVVKFEQAFIQFPEEEPQQFIRCKCHFSPKVKTNFQLLLHSNFQNKPSSSGLCLLSYGLFLLAKN